MLRQAHLIHDVMVPITPGILDTGPLGEFGSEWNTTAPLLNNPLTYALGGPSLTSETRVSAAIGRSRRVVNFPGRHWQLMLACATSIEREALTSGSIFSWSFDEADFNLSTLINRRTFLEVSVRPGTTEIEHLLLYDNLNNYV